MNPLTYIKIKLNLKALQHYNTSPNYFFFQSNNCEDVDLQMSGMEIDESVETSDFETNRLKMKDKT